MSDIAATVLPEPDSPTMPMVSPRSSVKLTPLTALTTPAWVKKCVERSLMVRRRSAHAYSLSLGSVASRRPLPNEMKPNTVVTSAMLGNSSHHQLPAAR